MSDGRLYLVRHGETGLRVNKGDVDGLAAAISTMMEDSVRRNEMADYCVTVARREFDVVTQASHYASVYAELCA